MDTRHLTAVVHEGQYKIAQYGQWDGYPEGQGDAARKFLREKFLRPMFLARLQETHWLTTEEITAGYVAAGHDGKSGVRQEVADRFNKAFPYLTRDHGAEILRLVQESTGPVLLKDSHDFAVDSLFCEWAYIVDLDKNTFEVYRGFNNDPLPGGERFSGLEPREKSSDGTPYYPVKHVITFPLDAIPNKAEFLKAIKQALPKDEDEEAA
jgi:hypothetical protein